jgi:uncharacterized membrane protein
MKFFSNKPVMGAIAGAGIGAAVSNDEYRVPSILGGAAVGGVSGKAWSRHQSFKNYKWNDFFNDVYKDLTKVGSDYASIRIRK